MLIYLSDEMAQEMLMILNNEDGFGQLPKCLKPTIEEIEDQLQTDPDERVNYQSF